MRSFKFDRVPVFGVLLFSLLNLLQAVFQPLLLDEAYYYYYSQDLALGYFDHPPLVSYLIKIGDLFGRTELGVRLGNLLLSIGTLLVLLKLTGNSDSRGGVRTLLLIMSFPFVHALHIAIPDSGLIFFTALFYLIYERYLKNDKMIDVILLGTVSAGLIYAKYHGVLTIFFAIITYPKILYRKTLWVSFIVFALFLFPHLHWLLKNDLVSIRFQLFGRDVGSYSGKNILEYLLSFGFVSFGLFVLILFIPANFSKFISIFKSIKAASFQKVLGFSIIGFLIFFLLFSLKGPIEANWIFSASIPAMILISRTEIDLTKIGRTIVLVSIGAFLLIRIMLMTSIIPNIGYLHHFSGYDQWAKDIEDKADGSIVYFENSYQMASMYFFQTGNESFSLNTLGNRSNQYDLNCFESVGTEKKVMIVSEWMEWESAQETIIHEKGRYKTQKTGGLVFLNNLHFQLENIEKINDEHLELNFTVRKRCSFDLMESHLKSDMKIILLCTKKNEEIQFLELVNAEFELTNDNLILLLIDKQEISSIIVGIQIKDYPVSNNSDKILIP